MTFEETEERRLDVAERAADREFALRERELELRHAENATTHAANEQRFELERRRQTDWLEHARIIERHNEETHKILVRIALALEGQ